MCDCFRLNGRENHMIAVRDDDGARAPSIGCVNQPPLLLGLLNDALDRRGLRTDNRDDAA